MRVCSADVKPCQRNLIGRESFADEKDNAEGLLNYPVLKIKNAKAGKEQ